MHETQRFTGAPGEVKLITLDPGHFHAALVQKSMYPAIDATVYVYAPPGKELEDHLSKITGYNTRSADPATWVEKVYAGNDFLEKMIAEKRGNVVIISGNNARKASYIYRSVEAGLNVLADKPMAISPADFSQLEKAFAKAQEKGVLLYDLMTERYEITTILQRELSQNREVFGELQKGTSEKPAITKESVHHFSKMVSGSPLIRPAWFFDVSQQGEGIVDVTTHLVDLVQWEAFPGMTLKKEDVRILSAKRWTTSITPEMFRKVTQLESFPPNLIKDVKNGNLEVYCNGEIIYQLKGVYAGVSVRWNFEAPQGAGDTHFSIMRGTRSDLIIRQGEAEKYKPELYLEATGSVNPDSLELALRTAFTGELGTRYPGLIPEKISDRSWRILIPEQYREGHEAHFARVTEKYLGYLVAGKMEEWEVPNMIVKYYTTTGALKLAKETGGR